MLHESCTVGGGGRVVYCAPQDGTRHVQLPNVAHLLTMPFTCDAELRGANRLHTVSSGKVRQRGACRVFRNAIVVEQPRTSPAVSMAATRAATATPAAPRARPGIAQTTTAPPRAISAVPGQRRQNYYATGCPVCSPGIYQVLMQPRGRVSFSGCNSCDGLPVLPPSWGHFGTLCNALGMLMSLYWVFLRHRTNGPIRVV